MSDKIIKFNETLITLEEFLAKNLFINSGGIVYTNLDWRLSKSTMGIQLSARLLNKKDQSFNLTVFNVIGRDQLAINTSLSSFKFPERYNAVEIKSYKYEGIQFIELNKIGSFLFKARIYQIDSTTTTKILAGFECNNSYNLEQKDFHEKESFLSSCKTKLKELFPGDILAIEISEKRACYFLELLGFELIQQFVNPNTKALLNYYRMKYENF